MIRDDEHVLAVAELFTSAAVRGDWTEALNAFADACGAERGELIGLGSDKTIPFNWIPRFDPRAFDEFAAIDGGDPVRNPRVKEAITAPVLRSCHHLQLSSDDELRRNFAYADFCRRWDAAFGSQTTVIRDNNMMVTVATLRNRRQGVPATEDRLAFETLAPHVLAAVRLQINLEGQGAHLIAGAFEAVRTAAFICDSFGLVKSLTPAAEAAVQRGPLRLKAGKLSASHPQDAAALEAAIREAVIGAASPHASPRRALVVRAPDAPELFEVVEVAALPRKAFALGFEPRAVVTLRGRPSDDAELSWLLRTAFGLTRAEAAVAAQLAGGRAREEIAAARGVSLGTVRMQIKRVFAKMNLHREAELFALIGRLR
jgi:DNA-binding CsgD family transcriptional regulator